MRSAMRNRLANVRNQIRTPRVTSDEEVLEIAQSLWSQLDTPLSLGLSLLANAGQIEDLLRVEVQPSRYLDSDYSLFRDDVQAVAFLKKMPLKTSIDRSAVAWKKFLDCEELCRQTNDRVRQYREGSGCSPAVQEVLHSAQWKISRWLGELDPKSWALRCRFGPGADLSTKGPCVSPYHKLSRLSSTEDFAEGAAALVFSHPSWARLVHGIDPMESNQQVPSWFDIEVVPGNKLVFVPKTALTDRSIAIEPRLNIYAQLGIGALLRQRLKRNAHLDLDDQAPSQRLAWLGSCKGTVATIDLSSASDTLAKELVRELIPSPWLTAMEWCRSSNGVFTDGSGVKHPIYYQKFSSMGNGYTFELESMIFYALALSCAEICHTDTSLTRAYGDDVAVPVEAVALLEEVFAFCGFEVNRKKSFSSGPFRESCGADYFNGVDVRPYFQKEQLTHVECLFRLANGLRRVAYRRNRFYGCDGRLKRVWDHVVRRVPPSLRSLKGPFRLADRFTPPGQMDVTSDDSYLAVNLDEAMSSLYVSRNRDVQRGWHFASAAPTSRHISADYGDLAGILAYALYAGRDGISAESSPHDRDGNRKVPIRGEGPRRLVLRCFTPEFLEVGPWV